MTTTPDLTGPVGTAAAVVVRDAEAADAGALYRLSAAFAADGCLLPRAEHDFADRIGEFLVALRAGEVVGCAGLTEVDDALVVYNLCVAAPAQGGGIGRRLIAAATLRGHRLGRRRLVAASRTSGHWFLRQGFQEMDPRHTPAPLAALVPPGRGSLLYCRGLYSPLTSRHSPAIHARS
ncbi:GNAT family N-acetyltransferase [Kitasatospora brasiliensis]|uniref:GNAT family N-acetyltransferase n=1 Tax=Kitasatospora brasiliensis TaxID=3058040 RepID=UPI00292ECAA9|nr:GNAT family N-acetyltransferase [Kitasatospora sp. K002]